MAYSSATLLAFLCVAITAATTPSTAQFVEIPMNFTGTLVCGNSTGASLSPVVNGVVPLICRRLTTGRLVVLALVNTTANGTIAGSARVIVPIPLAVPNLLETTLERNCMFLAPSSPICSGSLPGLNTTTAPLVGAPINVTTSGIIIMNGITGSPASGLLPLETFSF